MTEQMLTTAEPNYEELMDACHATRDRITRQRHDEDVLHARLRARLVEEMAANYRIDGDTGYLRLGSNDLDWVNEVLDQGQSLISRMHKPKRRQKRRRKLRLLGEEDYNDKNIVESPIFRFALQPQLIATVAQYLGFVPVLTTVDFWYNPNTTVFGASDIPTPKTQFSHLDWADNCLVKVFVHCSAVTANNGPIKLLCPQESRQIREKSNYVYSRRYNTSLNAANTNGLYLKDDMMRAIHGKDVHMTPLIGDVGTVYLADTSRCFHYGGRNSETGQERLLGILQFLRPGALKIAVQYQDVAPFAHLARPEHDLVTRLVLGGKP